MLTTNRTNTASATTRAIKKALAGRVDSVKVKSNDYCGGAGEVIGEIEAMMTARQVLMDAGFTVSEIHTYKNIPARFYVEPQPAKVAA